MIAKTLKYNHVHVCPANKLKKANNHEVQPQQDKPMVVEQVKPIKLNPIEPLKSNPIKLLNIYPKQTTRELRISKRQESIKSLISQAT